MIFVVGSGRSGTTVVARVLHERCGVKMGTHLPTRQGLGAVFEDKEFTTLHAQALAGEIELNSLRDKLEDLGDDRTEPWGMKCPATVEFLSVYRQAFPTARYVWAYRDPMMCIRSYRRVRPNVKDPVDLVRRRVSKLQRWFGLEKPFRCLRLDLSQIMPEEVLAVRLRDWLA